MRTTQPVHQCHIEKMPDPLSGTQVTASNLLLVDMEGNVIKGNGHPEATAFWIHRFATDLLASSGIVPDTHIILMLQPEGRKRWSGDSEHSQAAMARSQWQRQLLVHSPCQSSFIFSASSSNEKGLPSEL